MTRYECLEYLAPLISNELVVTSLSGQRVEWAHLSHHEGNLLLGSMGNALGVGLGLSLALRNRRVIVLESDGSVLLSLFNLPTLASVRPGNLAVVIFDNEAYSGTRISQPSATHGRTDLELTAKGAGIEEARTVQNLESFKAAVKSVFSEKRLHFVVAKVDASVGHRQLVRPDMDLLENKYRFMRYVERTQGKPVHHGRG